MFDVRSINPGQTILRSSLDHVTCRGVSSVVTRVPCRKTNFKQSLWGWSQLNNAVESGKNCKIYTEYSTLSTYHGYFLINPWGQAMQCLLLVQIWPTLYLYLWCCSRYCVVLNRDNSRVFNTSFLYIEGSCDSYEIMDFIIFQFDFQLWITSKNCRGLLSDNIMSYWDRLRYAIVVQALKYKTKPQPIQLPSFIKYNF